MNSLPATTTVPEETALSVPERERIREELRYAALVAREMQGGKDKPRPVLDRLLGYLSNGFVLLLMGSLLTSVLVPQFQRRQQAHEAQAKLMNESYAQFLAYGNSIWQEYYSIVPLTQEPRLAKAEYLRQVALLTDIKLKRYDAYAKALSLALAFRRDGETQPSTVEKELDRYAREVNSASARIDAWLTAMYCTPEDGKDSPCAAWNPAFDSFRAFNEVKEAVVGIGNKRTDEVAALIVSEMRSR